MQTKYRMNSGVWLAVGLVLAAMYLVNAIQASSIPYFVVALGWALLGVVQWWRWRAGAATGSESERAPPLQPLARSLTVLAFLAIAGGLAARWWA